MEIVVDSIKVTGDDDSRGTGLRAGGWWSSTLVQNDIVKPSFLYIPGHSQIHD